MTPTRTRIAWALLTAVCSLNSAPTSAVDPQGDFLPPETPDQPEAAFKARDDALARSPGLRLILGSYVSIQVNVDALGQNIVGDAANEPSIAVNPTDSRNMVMGWRQFDTIASNFRQAGWAYTFDGGENWTFPGVLDPGTFRSDPVLRADSGGTIHYQSLTGDSTVDVFRSTNGGISWDDGTPAFGGDKNWMAIDRTGGQGQGSVYGIWQRFAGCCGWNVLTRSTSNGDSYESPVPVFLFPTFGQLDVGPDGELWASGIDGTASHDVSTFVASVSTNAKNPGQTPTFSGQIVNMGGSMRSSIPPNPAGLLGHATVSVSQAAGPTRGHVYMVASVDPPGDDPLDVSFARSTNGGATWQPPVRVNDDASNENWQWFGAISSSRNGRLDVIWNDTRNSGQLNISQLFYAYSWDDGVTWSPNVAVSPSFNSFLGYPQQSKLGDYYDLHSDSTGADVAYAATFNDEQDVYYVRVFPDCNINTLSDVSDIATGFSRDCNLNRIPDECEAHPQCIGAGALPDGRYIHGDLLEVNTVEAGQISLEWGESCFVGDSDFNIYEGVLGDFTSHSSRFCGTDGELTKTFTSADGNTYYLVVPANDSVEGSYGRDRGGNERPQAHDACLPQDLVPCIFVP